MKSLKSEYKQNSTGYDIRADNITESYFITEINKMNNIRKIEGLTIVRQQ